MYVDGACCPPLIFPEKNHSVKTVTHPIGKRVLLNQFTLRNSPSPISSRVCFSDL